MEKVFVKKYVDVLNNTWYINIPVKNTTGVTK